MVKTSSYVWIFQPLYEMRFRSDDGAQSSMHDLEKTHFQSLIIWTKDLKSINIVHSSISSIYARALPPPCSTKRTAIEKGEKIVPKWAVMKSKKDDVFVRFGGSHTELSYYLTHAQTDCPYDFKNWYHISIFQPMRIRQIWKHLIYWPARISTFVGKHASPQ